MKLELGCGVGNSTASFETLSLLTQTWVKFSSLSSHSGGGILQLVGCCGACAIHIVGGHIGPVRGGGIILSILVLAKCRIWGIILQKNKNYEHTMTYHTKKKQYSETEMLKGPDWLLRTDFTSVPSHVSNLLSLPFCLFYISETTKAVCCCFLLTQLRWTLLWVSSLNLSLHLSSEVLKKRSTQHEGTVGV